MAFDWSQLIQPAVSGVLGAVGAAKNAGAANSGELWRRKMAEQEMARRNAIQGAAFPSLLRAIGMPAATASRYLGNINQASGQPGAGPSQSQFYSAPGALGQSGLSKGLGIAGQAAQSIPGVGAIAGPALGLASGVANMFGKGRRESDAYNKSVTDPFNKYFSDTTDPMVTAIQSGNFDKDAMIKQYQDVLAHYNSAKQANAAEAAKGGTAAKIASGGLANMQKWDDPRMQFLQSKLGIDANGNVLGQGQNPSQVAANRTVWY